MSIKYVQGDATAVSERSPGETVIIPHVCNDRGGWGAGFVLALSHRWDDPERVYRAAKGDLPLGLTQMVPVGDDIWVANMIAQVLDYRQGPNIRYPALRACMNTVALKAKDLGASLHCPRFGAGLAGGEWSVIEQAIKDIWIGAGLSVVVYDYVPRKPWA